MRSIKFIGSFCRARSQTGTGFCEQHIEYSVLNRRPATLVTSEQSGHLCRPQDANGRTWQADQTAIAAE